MEETKNNVTENKSKETKGKKVFFFKGDKAGKKDGQKPFKKDFKKKPEKPATAETTEAGEEKPKKFKKREDENGRNLYPIMELMDEKSRAALLSIK